MSKRRRRDTGQSPAPRSPFEPIQTLREPALRAGDQPYLLRIAAAALRHPGDPYLQEWSDRGVEQQAWRAALSTDPFYANYPPLDQPLAFDTALIRFPDGRVFGLPFHAFLRNVGVIGPTGRGKTSLLCVLLCQLTRHSRVLVIDRKRELRRLAGIEGVGDAWVILPWNQLLLALLQPPPGVSQAIWASELVSLTARGYSLYASQRPSLELLLKAYREDGSGANLRSWEDQVRGWEPGKGLREAGYKEALLWVLMSLRRNVPVLRYAQSDLLEKLYSSPGGTVIEVDSLPVEHYAFFAGYLQRWVYVWRLHNPGRQFMPIIFCLDDATVALDAQRDREAPGGVSILSEGMFMGRGLGLGAIWVSHSFSTTSVQIRHNTESFLVVGAQGDELRLLGEMLGTTPEQTAHLRTLQPKEAVLYVPATWPAPVYGQFEFLDSKVDEALLSARADEFLQRVRAILGGKPEEETAPDALASELLRLLTEAAFQPAKGVTVLYGRAHLDRSSGRAALEELHAKGLVRPHKLSTGRRGGQLEVLEVTAEGWKELTARGFRQPARVTRGGWLHNTVAAALGELGRRERYTVRYEAKFADVFVDVLWESPDGRTVAHQIGLSTVAYEVESAVKLAKAPGVDELVLAVRHKVFLEEVAAGLRGRLTPAEDAKVRLCCVGSLLAQVQ